MILILSVINDLFPIADRDKKDYVGILPDPIPRLRCTFFEKSTGRNHIFQIWNYSHLTQEELVRLVPDKYELLSVEVMEDSPYDEFVKRVNNSKEITEEERAILKKINSVDSAENGARVIDNIHRVIQKHIAPLGDKVVELAEKINGFGIEWGVQSIILNQCILSVDSVEVRDPIEDKIYTLGMEEFLSLMLTKPSSVEVVGLTKNEHYVIGDLLALLADLEASQLIMPIVWSR
jgi:hypothetical protein